MPASTLWSMEQVSVHIYREKFRAFNLKDCHPISTQSPTVFQTGLELINVGSQSTMAEWSMRTYPAPLGAGGVGSIPANSDAQNVPSFRRWRFEMKLSPFIGEDLQPKNSQSAFPTGLELINL
jgi:hypothetical protein